MRYRLYLYKTTHERVSDPVIEGINKAVYTESEQVWKENKAVRFLKGFNVENVKSIIEQEIGNKCRVVIKTPTQESEQVSYLYIATSYECVHEVLPRIYTIAATYGLVLYDFEKNRSFYNDLIDDGFISIKIRERDIREHIHKADKSIWHYKKISYDDKRSDKSSSFVVTLRKILGISFEERIKQFYDTLKEALIDGEEIICEDGCFTVCGNLYSITYCLEAYKKHSNMLGYYEDGQPKIRILNRMGSYEAYKWMQQCDDKEQDDIMARMHFREMIAEYSNPADRFVESVNITKQQGRELFDIRYSYLGKYGSEFCFHIVNDVYEIDDDEISVLKIEEDSASFILPFIDDVYPYIYERYYLTENHLPDKMWDKVIDRIKEAKEMILYDTFNPELKPYIEKFNLYALSKLNLYSRDSYAHIIRHEPEKFLFEHRYEVAHLYDIFIAWSDIQSKYYCDDGEERMFNVKGP